jgi:propanol-preferring alcohol dehydrogenase
MTAGQGVDVTLELVGLPLTMRQAVQSLGNLGRAVMVGLSDKLLEIDIYREVLGKETEIIGCSDHLRAELPLLLEFARQKRLDFSRVVTKKIPLDETLVNQTLAALHDFSADVRTVIVP